MPSKSKKLPLHRPKSGPKAQRFKTSYTHWWLLAAAAVIIAAGLLAYHNSFGGPFIFDDEASIAENPTIRQLFSIKEVLSPPAEGEAVQRRPIVNLSLAINYWLGGLEVRGYHVFNLSVHILAALTLFGVVRRTLRLPVVPEGIKGSSTALGLVIALIWTVHPLQTEAVTYIIQRTELLAGLFYLLTLYCVIRGNSSTRSAFWYVTAVISCTLGMGSKEAMVSGPLVILLYDRVFLCGSFKEVFRRRWSLYVGLAATWGLLVALIPHGHEGTAVFGRGSASLDYALTQFEVIANYLRLCFWPAPLILDYGLYKPTFLWEALPYAIFVIILLVGTVLAFRHRPGIGFLGVWFFAILAPSSSLVPLLGQPSAEKRMYLPLAAVVVGVVVCGYSLGVRFVSRLAIFAGPRGALGRVLGYTLAGAVIVVLSLLTIQRNADYRDELSIWEDTVAKQPDNWRAYNNRGRAYHIKGVYDSAIADFNKAIKLKSRSVDDAYNNRGAAYSAKGDYEGAIHDLDQAIALDPEYAEAYNNRGLAYKGKGDYDQAIRDFDQAIALDPADPSAYGNRGVAYASTGDYDQAIRDFDQAIALGLPDAKVYNNRGLAYLSKGVYGSAMADFNKAIALDPADPSAYGNRGVAYASTGDYDQAIRDFDQAIELNPRFAKAYHNRGLAYNRQGKYNQARGDFDQAIELNPRYTAAYNNRGLAYSKQGKYDRAIRDFNQAIELAPSVVRTYISRGMAYGSKGEDELARGDFEQAIKLNPRDALAHKNMAQTLIKLGRAKEAVKYYRRTLQLRADWPEVLNRLAWILATHKDGEIRNGVQAVRLAERACELLNYNLSSSVDTLAAAYAEVGQFDRAVTTAERAIQLAQRARRTELAEDIRARLALFKAKKTYREPFTSQDRTKRGPKE